MHSHDPYCKCYYPALTDPETCTWCYVIQAVRNDERKGIQEDIDIAYWQGYNNAMTEISEGKE